MKRRRRKSKRERYLEYERAKQALYRKNPAGLTTEKRRELAREAGI